MCSARSGVGSTRCRCPLCRRPPSSCLLAGWLTVAVGSGRLRVLLGATLSAVARLGLWALGAVVRPAWRRWLTALFPLAWAIVEIATGNTLWALLFGAVGIYAFWVLIVKGPSA